MTDASESSLVDIRPPSADIVNNLNLLLLCSRHQQASQQSSTAAMWWKEEAERASDWAMVTIQNRQRGSHFMVTMTMNEDAAGPLTLRLPPVPPSNADSNMGDGRIDLLPLTKVRHILSLIFPRKTYERVIRPTIDDIQIEYMDEVAARREGHAIWVHLRGYLIVVQAMVEAFIAPLIDLIRRLRG